MRNLMAVVVVLVAGMVASTGAAAERPAHIKSGDRIVFLGDSITEQRMYTNYVENYLLLRYPELKLAFYNAGWAGDTTEGGSRRLDRDVLALKPSLVTICYGMNDGGYGYASNKDVAEKFRKNLLDIVTRLKKRGVRVVIMTAGIVDDAVPKMEWCRKQGDYNANGLNAVKEAALKVAEEQGLPSVDLHALMAKTLAAGKKGGVDMGDDGIHPDEGGSLIMAYALLKALGVPPRNESIRIDAEAGRAQGGSVSAIRRDGEGLSFDLRLDGVPYCVEGKARKMLPYLPFSEDFNTVRLAFDGLKADAYYLKLDGAITRVYSRDELIKGFPMNEMWGTASMASAARVNRITAEKNNVYRQFWRVLSLPDNFIVSAPYDPEPHMLGIKLAGEVADYRRREVKTASIRVEAVPMNRLPAPLKAGEPVVRWRLAGCLSTVAVKEAKKEEKLAWTLPSATLPAGYEPAVLDAADVADNLKCALVEDNPALISAATAIESDAAQDAVVRLEGKNDFLVFLNGREIKWIKEADEDRDVILPLVKGRNGLMLDMWTGSTVRGFRVVLRSLPSPARLVD
jgi:lysophospholipase L1-like esterase